MSAHPEIRSAEACFKSSSFAVELAQRHHTRLHILHLTTARELELFDRGPIESKHITAEVCVHHLWFDDSDYADQGTHIKCNPAIKTAADRQGLIRGVQNDLIDVIATDHAPHTREEKEQPYFQAPAGLPLIQHSLQMLLQQCHDGVFSLEQIVTKAAHNPALLFGVVERGFLRESYHADIVIVDLEQPYDVTAESVRYKCGWSPLEGLTFSSSIVVTVLNGEVVFRDGLVRDEPHGRRLKFTAE
jgi:dihydroorotase